MRLILTFQALVAAVVLDFVSSLRAQPDQPASNQESGGLFHFMNTLPELVNQDLPFLEPGGTYWFYGHPHFGNPFQGKYFRLDVGGWLKVTDNVDLNLGAQSYFWRDPDDGNATRVGLYGMNLGVKYSHALSPPKGSAISIGVDHTSPVGRPPISLVNGFRHTVPYVTYTRPLIPSLRLVGYSTLGLDLLAHSPLPESFRTNRPPLGLDHIFGRREPGMAALHRFHHPERRDNRACQQWGQPGFYPESSDFFPRFPPPPSPLARTGHDRRPFHHRA